MKLETSVGGKTFELRPQGRGFVVRTLEAARLLVGSDHTDVTYGAPLPSTIHLSPPSSHGRASPEESTERDTSTEFRNEPIVGSFALFMCLISIRPKRNFYIYFSNYFNNEYVDNLIILTHNVTNLIFVPFVSLFKHKYLCNNCGAKCVNLIPLGNRIKRKQHFIKLFLCKENTVAPFHFILR